MNYHVKLILSVLLYFFSFQTFAAEMRCDPLCYQQKQMIQDMEFISNLFEISYAPLNWKSKHFGWDLLKEKTKVIDNIIGENLEIKDFQKVVKNFCMATKDYHVVPNFYSTESASLPIRIQSAEGKYFVTYVEAEDFFSDDNIPLEVGDQILSVNGVPISKYAEEFRLKEIGSNHTLTDIALAEYYLTNRLGRFGHDVPQGPVEVVYRTAITKERKVYKTDWKYQSEYVTHLYQNNLGVRSPNCAKSMNSQIPKPQAFMKKDPFRKRFMTSHFKLGSSSFDASEMLGGRYSKIPTLGPVFWESDHDSEFNAYMFMMDDWQVGGYIRIPSYYVDGDKAAADFAEIIETFQEITNALVIDQIDNGGGLILYLYALAAMLTDYELEVPKHRIRLTQEDVFLAIKRSQSLASIKTDRAAKKKLGDTIEGVVVNYKLVKCLLNSHNFIIDQWNAGKLHTDYCYLYGIEKIMPHPEVNYTKPILILTNELDFSAADFFPAIMQDNKRATIMGTRTAGAGGYVESISFPNLNGIEAVDVTCSFSLRPDGTPIENLGVTPDVIYQVNSRDLQNDYCDYKEKILQELKYLISD